MREVAASNGTITTVAGNGTAAWSGDGGSATGANLNTPWGLRTDANGNIYIAEDGADRVRIVGSSVTEPVRTMPTITWPNPSAISYGTALSASQLDATASVQGTFTYTPAAGGVLQAGSYSLSVLFTPNDTTDYSPAMATVPLTVKPVAPTVTWPNPAPIAYGAPLSSTQLNATANVPGTFAYTPDAGAVLQPGSYTLSLTFTPADTTDYTTVTNTVTLVVQGMPGPGNITTIAGTGEYGDSGDGGLGINADLEWPEEIAVDLAGNVYIPDFKANVIRKLTAATGIITTIAGTGTQGYSGDGGPATSAELNNPDGVTVDAAGNVYIADAGNNRIRKLTVSTGIITTVAGTGTAGYAGDGGSATSAELTTPEDVAIDVSGNLYIADTWNHCIREVLASSGTIATIAGNGVYGYSGDGGAATTAQLNAPAGIALDSSGNLYIADTQNNVIRKVTASTGLISTIAGNGTAGYAGNGGAATSAELNYPVDVAVDSAGNLFITDYNNFVIREVSTATGIISTLAGNGTAAYSGDGGPATSAELSYPHGVAADSEGNIYIGDCGNARVRVVGGTSPIRVSVNPTSVVLYPGQQEQFNATVTGTENSAVNWSISPNLGLISSGTYTAPANTSVEQTVTVTATSQADTTKSASAVVDLMPPSLNPTLVLSESVPQPYVVGTAEEFLATLKSHDGTPLTGVSVSFTVSGANPTTGSGTTDSNGVATITYTGANSGSDTIQATATPNGDPVSSGSISVTWLVPSTTVSTTTVTGEFFLSDGSGGFDTPPTATPAFTESFPTINFNPPSGSVPGAPSTINICTRPFTDVTTDVNGNYTGSIVAQGNGYQAGGGPDDSCPRSPIGNMFTFQAVFRGSFTVKGPGNVVFNFYDDDGFIFGIGNGATRVSGASWNMPAVTPFAQYPTMGADNDITPPQGNQVVVTFPAPGTYPYEVDYSECCGGQLVLTMTQGASSPTGIPPTGSLTLSPNSLQPLPQGGQQAFTVLATDAAGNPVPNLNVSLIVVGADTLQLSGTTDSAGHAPINYQDVNPGTATVQAVANISGMMAYSNAVSISWTESTPSPGTCSTLTVSASAPKTVSLPSPLQLTGSATDSGLPSGDTISYSWTEVSGPAGGATITAPQQPSTTVQFSVAGTYVFQLAASDADCSGGATTQLQVTVDAQPASSQGWISSPLNGSAVSGVVPILSGVALASGTLTYYPADISNPPVTTLNSDTVTSGPGQIGTLDTTTLVNGSYWIALQGTTTSGASQYNLILVTVTGNNKPGRVTTTVTDLVVPFNGLPIKIQRTYDSFNANTIGDFGYGWRLGTNVDLTVDPMGDVTFTLNGQRKTFYFSPSYGGWLFPWFVPAFTPEPGLFGTLTPAGIGCDDQFDFLVPDGNLWACIGGGFYTPPGYVYTDPSGTSYTMTAQGQLQSIIDKNGNTLTIGSGSITSSSGLSVTFARDSHGRITSITDPQDNVYQYSYDANGNLASVTYPNTPTSSTYTYDSNHLYLSGTDFNNNPLPTANYYTQADTDPNGLPLNGRLKSVTDALGKTTSYAYTLSTTSTINGVEVPNTSVISVTYPADPADGNGQPDTATLVYDSYGDLLSDTDPLGHTTVNAYNDASRDLTSTTDPMGNVTAYTYDANGNRQCTTYPKTATSTNTQSCTYYNQFSEPKQTVDELQNTRNFYYDVNYNPLSVTDSLGTLASFIFNPNGTMAAGAVGYDISADPSKGSTFSYDANGNVISRTDALGRTTSYAYNSLGQKTSMTAPPQTAGGTGATTNYQYDPFGNLIETDAPLGRTTISQYDGNGNKISDRDANGKTTGYKYDALNRLTETDYPDSTNDTKTYDFRGNVIDETDQSGHVTHHIYDLAGRLTSVTYAYGTGDATTISYTYDADGRKTSESESGNTTSYAYDAAGNLISVSGVKGNFTYTYDNARNRVSTTDGDNNKTTYVYDARKRLIETDYPDSTKKTYAYDGPGNLTLVTDQAGNQVQYSYDAANQLTNVVELNSPASGNNTTIYGYDGEGNPISLVDMNGHTTQQSFDPLNELSQTTLPDQTLTETRTYDPNGNLQTVKHFNGVTTTYAYDSLNRLLSRSTPGETTVSFTYTATGKRKTMDDASGHTTYNYDNMDRLTSKATQYEGTLTYTYDAAGNLASIQSSNAHGASMSYTYDSMNRLSTVVDNNLSAGANTTTYTYDGASNLYTVKDPSGVVGTYMYDQLNRVTGLGYSNRPNSYVYTRGSTGNLTSATEPSGRQVAWSFDGIYRLQTETISGTQQNNGSVSYTLDPVGNRLSDSSSLAGVPSGSWNYNSDDELSNETYDQDGNVTADDGKSFGYDSQNELVSMNGSAVQLLYDGDGNRVAKSVTSGGVTTTTYYLVDDLNPTGLPQVMDELTNGVVTRTYTYGLQRISEDQLVNNIMTPSFYSYDGMGNVRQLTNTAGAVTDSYEYDAFGNLLNSTGTTPNVYMYRGEAYDSDLGLYYLRARWMNPLTGRFMSRDPYGGNTIIPISLHKYLYASDNPVNRVDPRGRADLFEYAIRTSEAIPEAKLIDIYGCVADASLTAVDLMLDEINPRDTTGNIGKALGAGSTVVECVVLTPGLDELAEAGNKIVKSAQWAAQAAGWGACAADAEDFINALNDLTTGQPAGEEISKSIENLGGCVGGLLGKMLKAEE